MRLGAAMVVFAAAEGSKFGGNGAVEQTCCIVHIASLRRKSGRQVGNGEDTVAK